MNEKKMWDKAGFRQYMVLRLWDTQHQRLPPPVGIVAFPSELIASYFNHNRFL
jgi:hypothetical protein